MIVVTIHFNGTQKSCNVAVKDQGEAVTLLEFLNNNRGRSVIVGDGGASPVCINLALMTFAEIAHV